MDDGMHCNVVGVRTNECTARDIDKRLTLTRQIDMITGLTLGQDTRGVLTKLKIHKQIVDSK